MFDLWIKQPKVARSEYDTVYRWYEEKRDELNEVREALLKFASIGDSVGSEAETTLQLAKNARALLDSDTRVIKALERDNANLVEQIDGLNRALNQERIWKDGLAEKVRLLSEQVQPADTPRKRSTKKTSA